jgi:hypothetical protein
MQNGTWNPYSGSDSIVLALGLVLVAGILAYLGTRLTHPIQMQRPGTTVGTLLVVIWVLAFATFVVAIITYVRELFQQYGPITLPTNPICAVTFLSGLAAFFLIAYLGRQHGLKVAFGSAVVGSIAAPMIFELPFDLIVMTRTYPPTPAALYTPLFFLPLYLLEISSLALLTLSPLAKVNKYTLFSLAAMFIVFAIWACFGFSYPSNPISIVLNAVSKVLSFVTAITLFFPQRQMLDSGELGPLFSPSQ